jgi:hypothetical protein
MTTNFFQPSLLLLFLDPGSVIRDPGSGINIPDPPHCKKHSTVVLNNVSDPDSGSGSGSRRAKMINKNRKRKEISCFKVLDIFDPGSRIRDGKNSDPGSGLNILNTGTSIDRSFCLFLCI